MCALRACDPSQPGRASLRRHRGSHGSPARTPLSSSDRHHTGGQRWRGAGHGGSNLMLSELWLRKRWQRAPLLPEIGLPETWLPELQSSGPTSPDHNPSPNVAGDLDRGGASLADSTSHRESSPRTCRGSGRRVASVHPCRGLRVVERPADISEMHCRTWNLAAAGALGPPGQLWLVTCFSSVRSCRSCRVGA